jgi:competence protein ComEC
MNGLFHIMDHFNVKRVWQNDDAVDTESYAAFIRTVRNNDIMMPSYRDLPSESEISRVSVNILYPPKDFLDKKLTESWRNDNNNSMVIRLTYGRFSIIFPGDIMAQAERELVMLAKDELHSTVLVAPHHGSRTSSTDLFLDHVNPQYVIISAGWKNRFRLPHESVIQRYDTRGYQVYRTDIHGAVRIRTDGNKIAVTAFDEQGKDTALSRIWGNLKFVFH